MVGQAFYLNYPDRRESLTTMGSEPLRINQPASKSARLHQQTCSLTLMARRHPKTQTKTFQQRQTERHHADAQDRAIVEDMAKKYTCTNAIAHDFASQCHERITDVDFDIVCSPLALDFWADPPEAARPVVEVLRELAAERRRYHAALIQLQDRLLAFTRTNPIHEHLPLPIEHYQQQVRDRLFPDLTLRPAQKLAAADQP